MNAVEDFSITLFFMKNLLIKSDINLTWCAKRNTYLFGFFEKFTNPYFFLLIAYRHDNNQDKKGQKGQFGITYMVDLKPE